MADRGVQDALDLVHATRQRRARWPAPRLPSMTPALRIAASAAAVVALVVAVAAVGLHPSGPGAVVTNAKPGSHGHAVGQPGVRRAVRGRGATAHSVPRGVGAVDGGHVRRGESVPEEDHAHAPRRLVREYRWSVRRLPVAGWADRGGRLRHLQRGLRGSLSLRSGTESAPRAGGRRPRGRPDEPAGDDGHDAGRRHGQRVPRQAGHDDGAGQRRRLHAVARRRLPNLGAAAGRDERHATRGQSAGDGPRRRRHARRPRRQRVRERLDEA